MRPGLMLALALSVAAGCGTNASTRATTGAIEGTAPLSPDAGAAGGLLVDPDNPEMDGSWGFTNGFGPSGGGAGAGRRCDDVEPRTMQVEIGDPNMTSDGLDADAVRSALVDVQDRLEACNRLGTSCADEVEVTARLNFTVTAEGVSRVRAEGIADETVASCVEKFVGYIELKTDTDNAIDVTVPVTFRSSRT